jgi:hypothetical protein
MNDIERDEHLRAALRHAPDADARPGELVKASILAAARRAVDEPGRRPQAPRWWSPRWGLGASFAALLAATVLWVGREELPDEARDAVPARTQGAAPAQPAAPAATPPAQAQPTAPVAAPAAPAAVRAEAKAAATPAPRAARPAPPVAAAPKVEAGVRRDVHAESPVEPREVRPADPAAVLPGATRPPAAPPAAAPPAPAADAVSPPTGVSDAALAKQAAPASGEPARQRAAAAAAAAAPAPMAERIGPAAGLAAVSPSAAPWDRGAQAWAWTLDGEPLAALPAGWLDELARATAGRWRAAERASLNTRAGAPVRTLQSAAGSLLLAGNQVMWCDARGACQSAALEAALLKPLIERLPR